jgi:hypothetical protein
LKKWEIKKEDFTPLFFGFHTIEVIWGLTRSGGFNFQVSFAREFNPLKLTAQKL